MSPIPFKHFLYFKIFLIYDPVIHRLTIAHWNFAKYYRLSIVPHLLFHRLTVPRTLAHHPIVTLLRNEYITTQKEIVYKKKISIFCSLYKWEIWMHLHSCYHIKVNIMRIKICYNFNFTPSHMSNYNRTLYFFMLFKSKVFIYRKNLNYVLIKNSAVFVGFTGVNI